jgi:hypothetical protein
MNKILSFVWKVILAIVCLLFIEIILQGFFPAGIETKSAKAANAILFYPDKVNGLPNEIEITIDGMRAVFYKNTKPYNDLLIFLQRGRSNEIMNNAGPYPKDIGMVCGEMRISSYGIPFHFEIRRSDENTNYYRIILPKLTSPGRTLPIFTADPHIVDLIKTNRIQ